MIREFLEDLRSNWGWFLALGLVLIALGVISLGMPLLTTLASIVAFGWMLVFGGVFEGIALLRVRPSGVLLSLLGCVLSIVVGALVVLHPAAGAAGMTLLLAAFFIAGGVCRMIAAGAIRFPGWGWSVAGGAITTLLGFYVEMSWPLSSLWVIGTLVAVELLSRGSGWIGLAVAARKVPATAAREMASLQPAA